MATRAKKPAAARKKTATKKKAVKKSATATPPRPKHAMQRADYGLPIDGFFQKQPPPLRAVAEALRTLVEKAAPEAQATLKWGMPVYTLHGEMMCAIGAHKAHVNLILVGPNDAFADPDGRLAGEGKFGRHLKLTRLDELPTKQVSAWLRVAAEVARKKR